MFPRHACCALSRPRCNGHSFLLSSYLTRIGIIENPSCSACGHPSQDPPILFCPVQLRTLCAARSLATLCFSTTSGQAVGNFLAFEVSWSSAMPLSRGRGGVTTITTGQRCLIVRRMFLPEAYRTVTMTLSVETIFQNLLPSFQVLRSSSIA